MLRFRLYGPILAALALVPLLAGCPVLPSYSVKITSDIVFATGVVSDGAEPAVWQTKDLLLDVYEPEGEDDSPKPALIMIHGGGFMEGDKDKSQIVDFANYFARRGIVCFSIQYRLMDDHPPAPSYWDSVDLVAAAHASMVDVKAAIRFVRANAATYNVNPDKIALMGESAGAIAGVTAAVTNDGQYDTDGPDFPIPESNYPGVTASVAGHVQLWGSADHVLVDIDPNDPPIMIVHGDDDDNNPITTIGAARRLHLALELWDIPHEFYEAEGWGHSAWNYRENGKTLERLIYDFLNEYVV